MYSNIFYLDSMSFLFHQSVNPPQLPAFRQGANECHIEETRIWIHQAVLKVDETSIPHTDWSQEGDRSSSYILQICSLKPSSLLSSKHFTTCPGVPEFSLAWRDKIGTEEKPNQTFTLVLWKTALGSRVLVFPGLFLLVLIQQMSSHLL